jgi:XRE family transcriptional regulator, aerobic/anaerobic benzoate catabolism transcriptional regulator
VRNELLERVGKRVRTKREALGWTQRQLAERSKLSVRFLAQLEHGDGNISLARFADVATALGLEPTDLLAANGPAKRPVDAGPMIALLGLRGAGKSTVGPRLARRLEVPFFELDDLVMRSAGLSLAELFELHGEAYYRRLERETLRRFISETPAAVLATGGSIVNDRETFAMLRERATTVWLRARPEDHWNRVIQQGDRRPMAEHPHAFAELCALLKAREPLYATAHHVVDTVATGVEGAVDQIAGAVLPADIARA